MSIVNVSYKGQIVIPIALRKKFGIALNGKVEVTDFNNEIIIIPLPNDPIKEGRGFLKLKQSAHEIMQEYRIEEKKIEEKKRRTFNK